MIISTGQEEKYYYTAQLKEKKPSMLKLVYN